MDICVHYNIADNNQKVKAACMSINSWMDKQNCPALKRKEIMTHASTWINLEDIMVSDSGQEQKDKCYMSPLMSSWNHQTEIEWSGGPGQEDAHAT